MQLCSIISHVFNTITDCRKKQGAIPTFPCEKSVCLSRPTDFASCQLLLIVPHFYIQCKALVKYILHEIYLAVQKNFSPLSPGSEGRTCGRKPRPRSILSHTRAQPAPKKQSGQHSSADTRLPYSGRQWYFIEYSIAPANAMVNSVKSTVKTGAGSCGTGFKNMRPSIFICKNSRMQLSIRPFFTL